MEASWIFFADEIYASIEGVLNGVFGSLYGEFTAGLKIVINSLFHLFIIFYAAMAIKSGVASSIFSLARTILLLLTTFNISFNLSSFKFWAFDTVMHLPTHAAAFFVGTTISGFIPNFKPLSSLSTSLVFNRLFLILINRADKTRGGLSGIPSVEGLYLYLVAILLVVLYFLFWLIQFNFLIQGSIYMIIGIPVIVLASFKQTQSIFFEWLRAVVTLMLYPLIAAIVIFLVLNMLLPLSSDAVHIIKTEDITGSAIGKTFVVILFGFFTLKQVPAMAAVLTRGHMTTANPIDFTKNAIKTATAAFGAASAAIGAAAGAAQKATADPGSSNLGASRAGFNRSGSSPSPIVLLPPPGGIQKGEKTSGSGAPSASGSSHSSGSAAFGSAKNAYQSLPALSGPSASTKSGAGVSSSLRAAGSQEISVRPESVSTADPRQPAGHAPAASGPDFRQPVQPAPEGVEAGETVFNTQAEDRISQQISGGDEQTSLQQVTNDQSTQSVSAAQSISQLNQTSSYQSRMTQENQSILNSQSFSTQQAPAQPPGSQTAGQTASLSAAGPAAAPSQPAGGGVQAPSSEPPPSVYPAGGQQSASPIPVPEKGPAILPNQSRPSSFGPGESTNTKPENRHAPKIDTKI
ncbi:hypothetical protein KKI24_12530 [bacterium]|nr:hypothetical protein [bacterium]